VSPEDLRARLDAGEKPLIVDLRTTLDVKAAPYSIPGAIRLAAEDLEHGTRELPRDRDVILYCS
jgi:rhodanese-related sulfurtransferase